MIIRTVWKGDAAFSSTMFEIWDGLKRAGSAYSSFLYRYFKVPRLLRPVIDIIDDMATKKALAMLEIDELGLDPADRNLLTSIIENYGDNPVGLTTLAALTGDEVTTIEDFYEPYLLQIGFIEKTPRGRRVTPKAKQHLQKNQ